MTVLINGDCVKEVSSLCADSVDLTVTSPPYDSLRDYKSGFEVFSLDSARALFSELFRVTVPGGTVVWVVADQMTGGSESGTSFKQALLAIDCGFFLHDTMIFEKAQAFGGSNKAYLHSFEYMFVLTKGRPRTFNPIRDRKNVRGGASESAAKSGMRRDGSIPERKLLKTKVFGKRKNIWKYGVGGGGTGHPAVFPEKLARDHIISWSNPGDTVLDPFMGSGTTGIASVHEGRKFIGIELAKEYFEIARKRIEEAEETVRQEWRDLV